MFRLELSYSGACDQTTYLYLSVSGALPQFEGAPVRELRKGDGMATSHTSFKLMVSWDQAVQAIERALSQGRQPFEVTGRDNGFLRVRHGRRTTLVIEIRIETSTRTLVTIWSRRKWYDFNAASESEVAETIRLLREDIEGRLQRLAA